jgi:hypothetical protein
LNPASVFALFPSQLNIAFPTCFGPTMPSWPPKLTLAPNMPFLPSISPFSCASPRSPSGTVKPVTPPSPPPCCCAPLSFVVFFRVSFHPFFLFPFCHCVVLSRTVCHFFRQRLFFCTTPSASGRLCPPLRHVGPRTDGDTSPVVRLFFANSLHFPHVLPILVSAYSPFFEHESTAHFLDPSEGGA